MRQQVQSYLLLSRLEWKKTKAFSLSTQHGYIYLNRRDRFPQGTISPGAEAEAVCEELIADLDQFIDPETGLSVVEQVVRTRDLYPGPAVEHLPDLVVLWRRGYIAREEGKARRRGHSSEDYIDGDLRGGDIRRMLSVEQSGAHTPEGILIAHGPAFAQPKTLFDANVIDLAPTLLHLMGEPVPSDMSGRVLEGLFTREFLASHPVRYREEAVREGVAPSPYSAEQASIVEQHLRDLGYLE